MRNAPPARSDAALALPWLVRTRRGWLLIQVVLLGLAEASTRLHLHPPELMALLGAMVALDVAQAAWSRGREVSSGMVVAHAAVDMAALTGVLALAEGPDNPLVSAYLIYVALLAMALPAREAWLATGAAVLLHTAVVLLPSARGSLPAAHLLGHVATFVLASSAITWVVSRLSEAVRAREAEEARAERERATTERLAALGRLAAGLAHELGTPLGTLQLLAENRLGEGDDSDVKGMLEQIDRCRSMLDRLRGRDAPSEPRCHPAIAEWVAEWRRSAPDVDVSVEVPEVALPVDGAEESWRGALWVALDNARRAGARHVRVVASSTPEDVVVRVSDDGSGLTEEHRGEPFRSGWGSTGLGLFVARSFAESVGGDVRLSPGDPRGAVAELRMRRCA